jgi:subtilase family serine protease
MRALPDVAMLGDPATGLLIIAQGVTVQDGGTSLACPLFSASLVLINQARALLSRGPIGQAAPYLYQNNQTLLANQALNVIAPPSVIISGSTPPPITTINGTPTPASAFTINNATIGWDSGLTIEPEAQFWNDAVGVGSPNLPNFIASMMGF